MLTPPKVKRFNGFLFPFLSGLFILAIVLSACNLPAASTPGTGDPNLVYTAAAQTVAAELTQAANPAGATPTSPPAAATETQAQPAPTGVQPTPTQTAPVLTYTPSQPTQPPTPCDRGEFVRDVTIPDNTEMAPGTEFVKTWRLRNNGSCTWNSSYDLVFAGGNSMGGPAEAQLTTDTVEPGETIDISLTLEAPNSQGDYQGDWKLRNGSGVIFGIGSAADKPFWVKIKVTNATSYNFLAEAEDAEWRNSSGVIEFGDPGDDTPGVVDTLTNVRLEDGQTYSRVLATYPERIEFGIILGIFSPYTVKDGDHFRARVGFRSGCEDGRVAFQFGYMEGDSFQELRGWNKSCDGEILSINFDLSDLEGEEHEFVLAVNSAGSFRNDKAVWIDPRIQKQ